MDVYRPRFNSEKKPEAATYCRNTLESLLTNHPRYVSIYMAAHNLCNVSEDALKPLLLYNKTALAVTIIKAVEANSMTFYRIVEAEEEAAEKEAEEKKNQTKKKQTKKRLNSFLGSFFSSLCLEYRLSSDDSDEADDDNSESSEEEAPNSTSRKATPKNN